MAGNSDIHKYAKRFGTPEGPDPREAAKKSSRGGVRAAIRRYSKVEIPVELLNGGSPQDIRDFLTEGRKNIPPVDVMAIRKLLMAMAGHEKMLMAVTDDIDGKLTERVAEAKVTLEELVNGEFFDEGD